MPLKFGIKGEQEERQKSRAPVVRAKRMRQSEPEPEITETPQSTEGAPEDQTPRKRSRKEPPGAIGNTGNLDEHQPKLTSFYDIKSIRSKTELANVSKAVDSKGSTKRSGVNRLLIGEKSLRLEKEKAIKGTKLAPEDTSQQILDNPKVT